MALQRGVPAVYHPRAGANSYEENPSPESHPIKVLYLVLSTVKDINEKRINVL
jgi:hypothetical protein